MIQKKHVDGKRKGGILLYALSTCIWCRKTKRFLDNQGVAYDYIDVDLQEEDDKEKLMDVVRRWNPSCSFPTMVINDERAVLGYDERKIKEALGL